MLIEDEIEVVNEKKSGRYIYPHARGVVPVIRPDDFTVRVSNLPEDSKTLEDDLRYLFGKLGQIERMHLGRDKNTDKGKGFAYITYTNPNNANLAIETYNGHGFQHLILKVELTRKP